MASSTTQSKSTGGLGSDPVAAGERPLRLLQVLGFAGTAGERAGITGAERVALSLLEGLDSRRFEHYVAYPETGELFGAYRKCARVVLPLETRGRYDMAYVEALADCVRSHAIDVLLSHGQRYDFLGALTSRRTDIPHVVLRAVALADEPMGRLRKVIYGLVDAWTLRACSGIVAVSQASKQRMQETQGIRGERITVIPNGVRLAAIPEGARDAARRALGVAPEQILIGGAGQLIRRKSFDVLVQALAALPAELGGAGVVGVILGEGPERPHLAELARARGVRLLLPGYVRDPYPTMAAFDVAVLPSRAEGMPLVVLESMALGVPTIATPAAGTAELIQDGETGLLVPIGDAAALVRALARLLRDPELMRRLGAAGARRIGACYSLEAMLQAFDAYLTRVAQARRGE